MLRFSCKFLTGRFLNVDKPLSQDQEDGGAGVKNTEAVYENLACAA